MKRSTSWLPVIGGLVAFIVILLVNYQTQQAQSTLELAFMVQAANQQTQQALDKTVTALTPQPEIDVGAALGQLGQLIPTGIPSLPITQPKPIASGSTATLRLDVFELAPRPEGQVGVSVKGTLTNMSGGEVTVPLSAFVLRDSAGDTYDYADNSAQAVLKAGEATTLELEVPVPEGRGLVLVVQMQGEAPVELRVREETLDPGAPA